MSEAIAIPGPELRAMLSRRCEDAGGQSAWARKHGIAVSQVCEALSGKREVTDAMSIAMDLFPVKRFLVVKGRVV
jgi:hypothetical protein